MEPEPETFAAVVLAGGTGQRLGGVDKAGLQLDGRPLLAWALDAVAEAVAVAVVGPAAPTSRPVVLTREDPPGGGPCAGLLAGRDALGSVLDDATWLAVLAVDMPRVTDRTFDRLLAAARGRDGAFLHDDRGGRQLCGVVAVRRLDAVRPPPEPGSGLGAGHGMSMRRLLAPLDLAQVRGAGREAHDVDTWEDLRDLS